MLYAHWEGFVKGASEKYFELVADRVTTKPIQFGELSPHFRGLILWKRFKKLADKELLNFVATVCAYTDEDMGRVQRFTNSNLIDTESNLSARVFNRLARTLSIDVTGLEPLV